MLRDFPETKFSFPHAADEACNGNFNLESTKPANKASATNSDSSLNREITLQPTWLSIDKFYRRPNIEAPKFIRPLSLVSSSSSASSAELPSEGVAPIKDLTCSSSSAIFLSRDWT